VIEPSYTCPAIDRVQKAINDAEGELESALEHQGDPEVLEAAIHMALRYLNGESFRLEELRERNQELRDWGRHWADKAAKLERELEAAENELCELR
jgi:hypothetical protein